MAQVIRRAAELFRVGEWYDSKAPLLAGIFAAALVLTPTLHEFRSAGILLGAYMVFVVCVSAFGYFVNDFADREVDRAAGKRRPIAEMGERTPVVIMIVLLGAGIGPLLLVSDRAALTITLATLAFGVAGAYSVRPFRFKERGAMGLVVSSTAQRCLPVAVGSTLVPLPGWALAGWLLYSFFLGMVYILVHQLADRENDERSGVSTYARHHAGRAEYGIYACCAACVLLLVLLVPPLVGNPLSAAIIALGVGLEVTSLIVASRVLRRSCFAGFECVPLETFSNVAIPLACVASLAGWDSRWFFIGGAGVVWLLPMIVRKTRYAALVRHALLRAPARQAG